MKSNDLVFKHNFEIIFREHFRGLTYFARKYTGDLDSAKEIVHSVFIRIWENREEFDWEKPAKSYLFTSVYNRSLNYLRDNQKFISHNEAVSSGMAVDEPVYSADIETAELESHINKAIEKLPDKCREIFELSRFQNKKYTEIAAILDIPIKTVESRMSKALNLLKSELKDYLTILILILIKNVDPW